MDLHPFCKISLSAKVDLTYPVPFLGKGFERVQQRLVAAVFPQGDGVDQSDPGTGTINNKQTQSPSAQSYWIKNHA